MSPLAQNRFEYILQAIQVGSGDPLSSDALRLIAQACAFRMTPDDLRTLIPLLSGELAQREIQLAKQGA